MNGVKDLNGVLYVSRSLLTGKGIASRTMCDWLDPRMGVERIELDGPYYRYATLPVRTRLKKELWADEAALRKAVEAAEIQALGVAAVIAANKLSQQLRHAHGRGLKAFYKLYLNECGPERAVDYAKRHSLFAELLELRPAHTADELFAAYKLVEPDGYGSAASLSNALRRAQKVGLETFVRHGNEGNKNAKTTLPEHEYWVRLLASMGKGYEAPYILSEVNRLCAACGVKPLTSDSWVKKYLARPDVRTDIAPYRYGASSAKSDQPFLTLQTALHANDQWQIDGWTVPFYHVVKRVNKKGQTVSGWEKLTVFVVRDAHSRRALGYAFGASENTGLIMEALRHAVERTGRVPAEIVSDNHSFNKTQEADNFKQQLLARGTEWTITMNPQYKSIVERYFEHFDTVHCKPVAGWAGGSPTNRKRNARPTPEQRDELQKAANSFSADEVKHLVTRLLEQFNEAPLKALNGLSPKEAYEKSEQPHATATDVSDVMHLFWKTTTGRVQRGMLTLTKNGEQHRFYLPGGDTFRHWNGQEVLVRYEDDYSAAFLFHPKTEVPICECQRQQPTHGAKVNQTSADMVQLGQHKQRQQLNQQASRRANEELRDKVDAIHGEVPYAMLNPLTAPKEILLSSEAEYEVGQVLKRSGVNVATLPDRVAADPLKGTPFSQTVRARRDSGAEKANAAFFKEPSLRRVNLDEDYDDDE